MKLQKTQLAAAVGAALLVGGTAVQAQAPAQTLTVQLYGQVNRALMWADNETANKWFHVDGQPSSTRFGIQGTSEIAPGLRAGARIESEMKSNPSNVVSFAAPSATAPGGPSAGALSPIPGTDTPLFAERWLDAFFEGAWGRINIGQGSGAADDASTIDLSGTSIANGAGIVDWGGGIPFTNSAGGVIVTLGAVLDNLDFESRYDRVMYTTPVFGGFRAQVGTGQKTDTGEVHEASLWFSGKFAGELQAAIGWSEEKSGAGAIPNNETIGGSISWLSAAGFSVTAAYTKADISVASTGAPGTASDEGEHWYGKLGYKFGPHAISVAYFQGEDQAFVGDEAKAYTLGYVWNPVRWAEVYANYILYQLDHSRGGGDANDITIVTVGTRLRF
jgi:predicted porin